MLHLPIDATNVSDGYHTFGELYDHRTALFLALMRAHPGKGWWSHYHADGASYEGYYIAGIDLPTGPITYHLHERFDACLLSLPDVRELERAPEWDGHTSEDVVKRLCLYACNQTPFPRDP